MAARNRTLVSTALVVAAAVVAWMILTPRVAPPARDEAPRPNAANATMDAPPAPPALEGPRGGRVEPPEPPAPPTPPTPPLKGEPEPPKADDGEDVRPDGSVSREEFRLDLTVTDATTGKPVETFEGHAQWSGHSGTYVPFAGKNGRAEIKSARWWGADEAAIIDLAVEAKDHVPARVPVRYPRGQGSAAVEVRLVPVPPEERARVTIDVVDAAGKPFDGDWVVRIVDPRDSTQTLQDFAIPERTGPGRYLANLPPGRWTILVKANDWLGFLRYVREYDLYAGENSIRAVMPPHGTLVVRWPKAWVDENPRWDPSLGVYPEGGGVGSGVGNLVGKTEYRSATCLEGDWRVDIDLPRGGNSTRRVRVRAGEETVVDFGRP